MYYSKVGSMFRIIITMCFRCFTVEYCHLLNDSAFTYLGYFGFVVTAPLGVATYFVSY